MNNQTRLVLFPYFHKVHHLAQKGWLDRVVHSCKICTKETEVLPNLHKKAEIQTDLLLDVDFLYQEMVKFTSSPKSIIYTVI